MVWNPWLEQLPHPSPRQARQTQDIRVALLKMILGAGGRVSGLFDHPLFLDEIERKRLGNATYRSELSFGGDEIILP